MRSIGLVELSIEPVVEIACHRLVQLVTGFVLVILQRDDEAVKHFLRIAGKVNTQFLVLHAVADECANLRKRRTRLHRTVVPQG